MSADSSCPVDVIYLAACSRDARLTRICLASIRYFYPDVPIKILAGDILQRGLAKELKKHWNIEVAQLPVGDFGWGFVKLEPLFGPKGQRFMVCDVDTAFTGRVLDERAKSKAPFWVDNEMLSDDDFKRLYFDWEKLSALDPDVQSAQRAFNVGQWFGEAGLVTREEFDAWLEWTLPRRLKYPDVFMGGDQGVMNYVVLKKEAFEGLRIDRHELMRWPGNGMDDLSPAAVRAGTAPARVIHWAGLKAILLQNMIGGDLLQFYEDFYYSRMPLGRIRRILALWRHVWLHGSYNTFRPFRLAFAKRFGGFVARKPSLALVKESIAS